ncbi:MAG: hypothetical protein AAB316_07510 [Bacteroidota bacterium]
MITSADILFKKVQNPILQATAILAAILVFDLGGKLLQMLGMDIEQRYSWTVTASFILFFAILNSVVSILAKNLENYWGRSIMSFLGLAVSAGVLAYLFSSLGIDEAGPYRWLYIVLTIGYLVFLSIIGFMKKIVEFAQREEWNQPRLRRRKR